jgi:hypothetical protein
MVGMKLTRKPDRIMLDNTPNQSASVAASRPPDTAEISRRNHEQYRNQHEQREGAAHQEDEWPAEAHHQGGGNRAADYGTQWKADEHQNHQSRAALRRTAFRRDRGNRRNGATHTETADKAQRGQHRCRGSKGTAQRENTGHGERQQQHRTASEAIGQRSDDQRPQHRADEPRAEYAAKGGVIDLQRFGEQRGDKRQHQCVESIDHRDGKAHERYAQHVADRWTCRRLSCKWIHKACLLHQGRFLLARADALPCGSCGLPPLIAFKSFGCAGNSRS